MQKTFNYLDKNAAKNVAYEIKKMINKDCVLLFIGTDKCIGDAFAPLVGSILESYNLLKNPIFGTIKHPVHALNINDTVECIRKIYPKRKIFVIDSMISQKDKVGDIILLDEGIMPGIAVGKNIAKTGDISLTLVVSNNERDAINSLTTLRLNNIYEMAKIVSESIFYAFADSAYTITSPILQ